MKRGCGIVMWGLLLSGIHIYIGSIQIFPPFVGITLIFYGIGLIAEAAGDPRLIPAKWTCMVWAVLNAAYTVMDSLQAGTAWRTRWSFLTALLFAACEMWIFHSVFGCLVDYFTGSGEEENRAQADRWIQWDRVYLIFMTLPCVLLAVQYCTGKAGWELAAGIIVVGIKVLTALRLAGIKTGD